MKNQRIHVLMPEQSNPFKILIVEDDLANRLSIEKILSAEGYDTWTSKDGLEALECIQKEPIDLVLSDLKMPNMDGMDLLRNIQKKSLDVEFVMMTAHGTIETAVEAMQKGAQNFVTKPFGKQHLLSQIKQALKNKILKRENDLLKAELERLSQKPKLIGSSAQTQKLKEFISQVAPTSSTVLLLGESGVGKEVVCHEIVAQSQRKDAPFIKLSCAALPESLLEAELFGYEKGAFTGAYAQKKGHFEEAHGGTLFLDEIGDISAATQVKLLRVLQEGEIFRLGASQATHCDVRIIAATNKNLEAEVEKGRFRQDLFFRLNVLNFTIAALRERQEDIPLLSQFFLSQFSSAEKPLRLSNAAREIILNHTWPGNVRELRNTLERASVLSRDGCIQPEHLAISSTPQFQALGDSSSRTIKPLAQVEQEAIMFALSKHQGDKNKAAKSLGIGLRTLYRKLESYETAAD